MSPRNDAGLRFNGVDVGVNEGPVLDPKGGGSINVSPPFSLPASPFSETGGVPPNPNESGRLLNPPWTTPPTPCKPPRMVSPMPRPPLAWVAEVTTFPP